MTMSRADGRDRSGDRALNRLLRRPVNFALPPRARGNKSGQVADPEHKTGRADPARQRDITIHPLCVRIPMAVQMLGVCRTKVYHLIQRGELETVKIDGSTLITTRSLEAFVDRHARIRGQ